MICEEPLQSWTLVRLWSTPLTYGDLEIPEAHFASEAALLADIRDVFGPVHLIQWIASNGRFTRCPLSPEKVARRSEWEDV